MEPNLYNILLLTNAGINLMLSIVMVLAASNENNFHIYRRSLLLTAIVYIIFAAGFIIHWQLQWRTNIPILASALSLTYFHIAAVLLSWGHIGLCDARYLSATILILDLIILSIGLICYWTYALGVTVYPYTQVVHLPDGLPRQILRHTFLIFILHAVWLSITFYRKYYKVQREMLKSNTSSHIRKHIRFMALSCHLIILFGIGAIIITTIFSTQQWPYCILMIASIIVFSYISISLILYSDVIRHTNPAIEQTHIK